MNATSPNQNACDVRFGQVGLACVRLYNTDAAQLCADLEHRVNSAPDLFERVAVVVDLSHLSNLPDDGTLDALLEAIRTAGMLPAGLAYGDRATNELAMRMGLPVIAKFREAMAQSTAPTTTSALPRAEESPTGMLAMYHTQPIRSGQQIYAKNRDLVITSNVANGAEIIADGSIHVYGRLRGRALAGAQGNTQTRIFSMDFKPELVSIAGCYRVFEQMPEEFTGKIVQTWLDNNRLLIDAL